ncbi:unnamed protein product [Peniophora sp. CBMAI 1063]|nr:unnamed protein product [Peniophora sp. CBMAI 1063]
MASQPSFEMATAAGQFTGEPRQLSLSSLVKKEVADSLFGAPSYCRRNVSVMAVGFPTRLIYPIARFDFVFPTATSPKFSNFALERYQTAAHHLCVMVTSPALSSSKGACSTMHILQTGFTATCTCGIRIDFCFAERRRHAHSQSEHEGLLLAEEEYICYSND